MGEANIYLKFEVSRWFGKISLLWTDGQKQRAYNSEQQLHCKIIFFQDILHDTLDMLPTHIGHVKKVLTSSKKSTCSHKIVFPPRKFQQIFFPLFQQHNSNFQCKFFIPMVIYVHKSKTHKLSSFQEKIWKIFFTISIEKIKSFYLFILATFHSTKSSRGYYKFFFSLSLCSVSRGIITLNSSQN